MKVDGDAGRLRGVARDPDPPRGKQLVVKWTLLAGPAAVQFENPRAPRTRIHLPTPGEYLLHLRADDGELFRSDVVRIVRER